MRRRLVLQTAAARCSNLRVQGVHVRLRKIIKTRGHFPTDESATKLKWLALRKVTAEWSRPSTAWKAAMNQFAVRNLP